MTTERIKRKLAAIVSADVVGWSRLMGEDEAGTLATLKRHREEVIDPKIAELWWARGPRPDQGDKAGPAPESRQRSPRDRVTVLGASGEPFGDPVQDQSHQARHEH